MENKFDNVPGWQFTCPPYDERSGCFLHAGSEYGVGHLQPIGSKHVSTEGVPKGRIKTLGVDERQKK